MQRPIMNPSFLEQPPAAEEKRRFSSLRVIRRIVRLVIKAAANSLLFDPFARLRSKGLRIDEGTPASRFLRGLLYRMAFVPILLTLLVAAFVYAGTHPRVLPNDADPSSLGIYYDEVTIRAEDGVRVGGWLVPVLDATRVLQEKEKALRQKMPAVVLVHDYGNRRQQMLPLVRPLHEAGFVVLVLGLRGCGTSEASAQTFGLREAMDVKAAVELLRRRSFVDASRIAVVGVGTGATAALIVADQDPAIAAVVADSPIRSGAEILDRYLGPRHRMLSWMRPMCRWAFEIGFHVDMDDVRLSNYRQVLQSDNALLIASDLAYPAPADSRLVEQVRDFMVARVMPKQAVASTGR